MSTRTTRFFMTPEEFVAVVDELQREHAITVLVQRQRPRPELRRSGDDLARDLKDASLLFLARGEADVAAVDPDEPEPAREGWAVVRPPRRVGNVLYLGDLASKSDYLEGDRIEENREAHRTYEGAARVLKKRLRTPVWGRFVGEGDGAEAYHDLRYSEGAGDLARGGVELRQEGVDNVVFSVDPPP